MIRIDHLVRGYTRMRPWSIEYGTFWVWDIDNDLPPRCPARVDVTFQEAALADVDDLKVAMGLPAAAPIQQRLQSKRRCFVLKSDNQIVTYGWVTLGPEHVGELERDFRMPARDAYVWDCGTVPTWRGQRCYSAFLNYLIYQLYREGIPRIWIGSSRQNQPSIRGFINAGFHHVIDLTYWRIYGLTILWFKKAPAAVPSRIAAAYHILLSEREHRLGSLAVGYRW